MSASREHPFDLYLNRHDGETWSTCLTELLPSIHEVDRVATRIWFAFYPLGLQRALEAAPDPALLARQLLLEGRFHLKDQLDSSHYFLYGHRYWPAVKSALVEYADNYSAEKRVCLVERIKDVARRTAQSAKTESQLVTGIAAVAFMTMQQVGREAFGATPGVVEVNPAYARKTPEQIVKERAADDSQGLFGFLRKADKTWTVVYNEADARAKFKAVDGEELASAAARDSSRDWRAEDARCIEGPIPVQCRSAACGTCWVGVLGGAEKLSDVSARESKKIKEFGYINTCEPKPVIRLACMAQASGAVSIVIPPWNGVFGKQLGVTNGGPDKECAADGERQAETVNS